MCKTKKKVEGNGLNTLNDIQREINRIKNDKYWVSPILTGIFALVSLVLTFLGNWAISNTDDKVNTLMATQNALFQMIVFQGIEIKTIQSNLEEIQTQISVSPTPQLITAKSTPTSTNIDLDCQPIGNGWVIHNLSGSNTNISGDAANLNFSILANNKEQRDYAIIEIPSNKKIKFLLHIIQIDPGVTTNYLNFAIGITSSTYETEDDALYVVKLFPVDKEKYILKIIRTGFESKLVTYKELKAKDLTEINIEFAISNHSTLDFHFSNSQINYDFNDWNYPVITNDHLVIQSIVSSTGSLSAYIDNFKICDLDL